MAKTSTAMEVGQEGSLREGLEAAIRERVREIIEMVLQEEVAAALDAPRSGRVAERAGYRHGSKQRKLTLRTGRIDLDVPRARLAEADGGEREWQSQLVPRYRRSSWEVEQSVPQHTNDAVREEYHRMVYAETRAAAEKAREGFLVKWKKLCPGVAASLEEAGENLLTFYQFPESQWLSLRTTNAIERMELEFRRRVKTQAALPNKGVGRLERLLILGVT